MRKRKKILVTGVSGTIGKEVLNQLLQNIDFLEITAFDKKSPKTEKILSKYKKQVTVIYGDITNQNDINKICHNKDVVIHLAALIPPIADEKPDLAHQINTVGTEKLIRSLEKHSTGAFVIYSSSVSVYGDRVQNPYITIHDELNPSPRDEYAVTKIKAENIIRKSKLDWTIFRLSAIMGGHKMSKLMFHQPLKTSLEITTYEDTARALVHSIEKQEQLSKKTFNLGGGERCRTTYKEFLSRSFTVFGLGKLNFHPKAFADKNFHCGFYEDGEVLDTILHFRRDNLDSYFEKEKQKIFGPTRVLTFLFKGIIKKYLEKQSEPLHAFIKNDKELIQHFFNSNQTKI